MDESTANMKYSELRQLAKDLGIENLGTMRKKEQILEAVKTYYEEKQRAKSSGMTKSTRRAKAAKEQEEAAEEEKDDCVVEEVVCGRASLRSASKPIRKGILKNSNVHHRLVEDEEDRQEEAKPALSALAKKKKKASAKSVDNLVDKIRGITIDADEGQEADPADKENEEVEEKKPKKTSSRRKAALAEEAPIVEEKPKVKKSSKSKKANKSPKTREKKIKKIKKKANSSTDSILVVDEAEGQICQEPKLSENVISNSEVEFRQQNETESQEKQVEVNKDEKPDVNLASKEEEETNEINVTISLDHKINEPVQEMQLEAEENEQTEEDKVERDEMLSEEGSVQTALDNEDQLGIEIGEENCPLQRNESDETVVIVKSSEINHLNQEERFDQSEEKLNRQEVIIVVGNEMGETHFVDEMHNSKNSDLMIEEEGETKQNISVERGEEINDLAEETNNGFNLSLLTDDESNEAEQIAEPCHIAHKPEISEESDLSKESINEAGDEKNSNPPETKIETNNDATLTSSNILPSESAKSQAETEVAKTEVAKPKIGGARIVRPKQTVLVVTKSDSDAKEEVVVTKKVVEIVRREAGPRIVKPVVLIENNDASKEIKRKNSMKEVDLHKLKKVKDAVIKKKDEAETSEKPELKPAFVLKKTKVPDFRALHEREAQKLESVTDNVARIQERHAKLVGKKPENAGLDSNGQKKLESISNSSSVESINDNHHIKPLELKPAGDRTKAKSQLTTPKPLRTHSFNTKKKEDKEADPKTPVVVECGAERKPTLARTPSSAINKPRPNLQSIQQSTKKPSVFPTFTKAFKFENQNLETSINFSNGCIFGMSQAPTTSNTAGSNSSSAFSKRKSFDINASLMRPLNYNPHVGKLKPVEISAKSVHTNQESCGQKSKPFGDKLNTTYKMNLNETVSRPCGLADERRQSLIMQRKAFHMTSKTNKPDLNCSSLLNTTVTMEDGSSRKVTEKEIISQKRRLVRNMRMDAPRETNSEQN